MSRLVPSTLSHLSDSHLDYFRHWCHLLLLESSAERRSQSPGGAAGIWLQSAHDRFVYSLPTLYLLLTVIVVVVVVIVVVVINNKNNYHNNEKVQERMYLYQRISITIQRFNDRNILLQQRYGPLTSSWDSFDFNLSSFLLTLGIFAAEGIKNIFKIIMPFHLILHYLF